MTKNFSLLGIASLVLIFAIGFFIPKQQNSLALKLENERHQVRNSNKKSSLTFQTQQPTKSSNEYRTHRDVLIKERERLLETGLALKHPAVLAVSQQIE